MNITERFIELRFPNAFKSYKDEWRSRFDRGLDYAKSCMDLESLEVFRKVLYEWISENF